METLSGKVAVVTGAGSGIGRATALALAREGAIVAAADLDIASAKETASLAVGAAGTSAHQVDVSSEEQMRALVESVLAEHGVVDVVVNNAGIASPPTQALDIPLSTYRRVMEVNYWGMVHGSLFFLPHLLARPEANLVNVASNASFLAYSRMAPYCGSKFAIRGFTEVLRMELRKTNVGVTVVCPGATRTGIMRNSPMADEAQRQKLQRNFDKTFARPPETVAKAIVNAIRKNRPRAIVGPDTVLIDAVVRLFPGRYSRILGFGTDKFLDQVAGKG